MTNYGDITKISGYDVPPVNVIIGGSPCQDLSIAGKRSGLSGERSGLFMDQVRIIKEMRDKDARAGRAAELIRPRFMVWENVPGAFSSNKAEDFRIVLEETAKIADPDAVIPRPPKGKWTTAGCVMGDGWSIAWRVLDAQFWGVPQRRRRIALVADFGGQTAPEILFEREGVSGDTQPRGAERESAPEAVEMDAQVSDKEVGAGCTYCIQGNCIDRADTAGCNGKGWAEDVSYTLNTIDRHAVVAVLDRAAYNQGENAKYDIGISEDDIAYTVVAKGPGAVCAFGFNGHKSSTASIQYGQNKCPCIEATKPPNVFTYIADEVNITSPTNASNPKINGKVHTLSSTNAARAICAIVSFLPIIRRLTPLECERVQGYPDGWTDIGAWTDSKGKKRESKDTLRYKALGNSIALPPWTYVLGKLSAYCGGDHTMASLFDGIGGFPLIWERLNGKGHCLWVSEIDDFPSAVTRRRFEEECPGCVNGNSDCFKWAHADEVSKIIGGAEKC